jgi:hypothetical protein
MKINAALHSNARIRSGILLLVIALVAGLSSNRNTVDAQEGPDFITLDENKLGEVSAAAPQAQYVFVAGAALSVEVEVLGITSGLAPQLLVTDETGNLVAAFGNTNLANTVSGAVNFEQPGTYIFRVSSANVTTGQFLIRIRRVGPVASLAALVEGQPVSDILAGGETAAYQLNANSTRVLALNIRVKDAPGGLSVELRDSTGVSVATLGNQLLGATLNLPPGETGYVLELRNDLPVTQSIAYEVLLQPLEGESEVATPPPGQVELPKLPDSGPCVLATRENNRVNVRRGPSVDFEAVATISQFEIYDVVGRNDDSTWYVVDYGDGQGWIAGSVTRLGGDCTDVPKTEAPPTTGPTITPTSPGQIAGDNEFRDVEVAYGGPPVNLTGAISYPLGDQQDTITYRWTNWNSQNEGDFRYSISCSGPGVENAVIMFLDGSASRPCSETPYNFQQLFYEGVPTAGGFTIALQGGDNAYVTWNVTLSFFVPR